MDVDKLFKLPSLPSAALNKRKWSAPNPSDASSSSSVTVSEPSAGPSAESSTSRPAKAARVDDEDDHDSPAAQEDETYFLSDDDQEDGRFFSGGLTSEQQHILDIMDSGDNQNSSSTDPSSVTDIASLRKQLLRFEKAITRNAEMRVKHADDPSRFIDSEADLHTEIKSLLILTTSPTLFYPEFVKLGGAGSLAGLLTHENADISAAAIEVIEEVTDDDVLDTAQDAEGGNEEEMLQERQKAAEAMNQLVEAFLEQGVLDLLVSNLGRFNDTMDEKLHDEEKARMVLEIDGDFQAIYHTLGALENLVTSRPSLSEQLVSTTSCLDWVLTRLSAKRTEPVDQNTAYSAELLAILLQSSESNRALVGTTRIGVENESGIDMLLTIIARYRRASPSGAEEEEFAENIFDSLCLCLSIPTNKKRFLDGEGVELMVLLMKEKKTFGRRRGVKVLDHASGGPYGGEVCKRLVEVGGLSPLFSVLMDCGEDGDGKKKKRKGRHVSMQDAEHVLGILSSLLTHLESDSMERIRVLSKFVIDNYQRLDHLLDLRDTLISRLDSVFVSPRQKHDERDQEQEEEVYLTKLEMGLFSLQLLDTVIAWIVMEDDAAKDHIRVLLKRKGFNFKDVTNTLKEYRDNIADQVSVQRLDEQDEGLKTKHILTALIAYVEAL
ncbi:related to nuclear associated protein [Melanopsichium pennsylvanicum]|uniref:Related to nuclear associated protein n=2 Tax=Melanopsichium pennsylvanicum TaxID=63383 RepID=A0AAJ5C3I0_9BASI|nr:duf1716-domain-containing protein [Melanopsichium pennsylvanicum 4]SNX82651.1 related to nuclear associated protein [Melanopsichium pennsylvanicum]